MPRRFTYAATGVDRNVRAESKKALNSLAKTYTFSRYGKIVELPFGNIFPFHDLYLDFVIEGVGTKVFLAQLADKHDTIAIDGIAMAVNDVIRSGAKPFAVSDNIHEQISDPTLMREWMKGIIKGAEEADCIVPSGETGDVAELIKGIVDGKGLDMVFASVGEVAKENVIYGRNIKPGDVIIGLRSSGLHSNGISLARRILFKQWGGKYGPDDVPAGLDRKVILEALEPTMIYVKPFLRVAREINVKAAVHITGDAYLKFNKLTRFSKGIGFEFNNFKPQAIFTLIQETVKQLKGTITDEEMFKTFNMGWGFALVVEKAAAERTIELLNKSGGQAEQIGQIKNTEGVRIRYKNRKILLK